MAAQQALSDALKSGNAAQITLAQQQLQVTQQNAGAMAVSDATQENQLALAVAAAQQQLVAAQAKAQQDQVNSAATTAQSNAAVEAANQQVLAAQAVKEATDAAAAAQAQNDAAAKAVAQAQLTVAQQQLAAAAAAVAAVTQHGQTAVDLAQKQLNAAEEAAAHADVAATALATIQQSPLALSVDASAIILAIEDAATAITGAISPGSAPSGGASASTAVLVTLDTATLTALAADLAPIKLDADKLIVSAATAQSSLTSISSSVATISTSITAGFAQVSNGLVALQLPIGVIGTELAAISARIPAPPTPPAVPPGVSLNQPSTATAGGGLNITIGTVTLMGVTSPQDLWAKLAAYAKTMTPTAVPYAQ